MDSFNWINFDEYLGIAFTTNLRRFTTRQILKLLQEEVVDHVYVSIFVIYW